MQCPYCSVEYSFGESCFCQPMLWPKTAAMGTPKVNGPWGETVAAWSLPPDTGEGAITLPSRTR